MKDIIQLTNISKKYFLEYGNRASFKESFLNLYRGNFSRKEFWALKAINLAVRKGEVLGIIGKNGSGKTTLLRILSGVTQSTSGSIKVNGKVASLLELGAGFREDLTGRENIYLNGLILGFSRKEITKNIDSIIDFADIGDFIDTPVRTYSAGMYLRLGFAIAAQLDPDILLIDEVMSVGDAEFQKKCLERIERFKNEGKTILFVSHSLGVTKNLCSRVLFLDKGEIVDDGPAEEVINRYLISLDNYQRQRTQEVSITNVYFKNNHDQITSKFINGEEMHIIIEYIATQKVVDPVFGIGIYAQDSFLIGPNTRDDNYLIDDVQGKGKIELRIKEIPFAAGEYEVSASAHNRDESRHYDYRDRLFKFWVLPGKRKIKYGLIGIAGEWSVLK